MLKNTLQVRSTPFQFFSDHFTFYPLHFSTISQETEMVFPIKTTTVSDHSRSRGKTTVKKNIFSLFTELVEVLTAIIGITKQQKKSRFSKKGSVNSKPRNASLADMKQIQIKKEITLPNIVFGLSGQASCLTSYQIQTNIKRTPLGRIKLTSIKLITTLQKKTLCDVASVSSGTSARLSDRRQKEKK